MTENGASPKIPNFGDRLIAHMKKAKVINKELARALDSSESQVSRWRNSRNPPDTVTLIRMADYFGISLDELVGRDFPVKKAAAPRSKAQGTRGRAAGGRHPADVQGGAPGQESPGRGRGTHRAG